MENYYRVLAGVLIGLILILTLKNRDHEIAILLTVIICALVGLFAMEFLAPVIEFAGSLQKIGNISSDTMHLMLKVVGIGLLTELGSRICADAGSTSLGQSLQLGSSAVILYLSLPLLRQLLQLLQNILGAV
jgi:stage III sporulation protein AD